MDINKFGIPDIKTASDMLEEAGALNPGPWVQHSIYTGRAASSIASHIDGLDAGTAMVLGMLHDIGRRCGVHAMRHSIDGYNFAMEKGYPTVARICITHSFPYKNIHAVFGEWDCTQQEFQFINDFLDEIDYNDYDRLIQLCDALALPTGFCLMEKRMVEVALRYGLNELIVPKWKAAIKIREDFEKSMGRSVYSALDGVVENTFDFMKNHNI